MSDLHPSEERLPATTEQQEAKYVDFAMDLWRTSSEHYSQFRSSCESRYDIVRGYFEGDEGVVGWNNVTVNFLMSALQSGLAKKSLILWGERPYTQFVAPPDLQAVAKKRATLIEGQVDDGGFKDELNDFLYTSDLYGRAILRYHWKREYGDHLERERTWLGERIRSKPCPRTGMSGIKYDGPGGYNIDPLDFFAWPGLHRLKDMPGVGEQFFPDFEDIVVGAMKGPNGEPPIYNPRVVDKMRYDGGDSRETRDVMQQRFDMASGQMVDRLAALRTSFAKPCWGFEAHMRVPRDFAVYDPERRAWTRNVVITVINGKHLLRVAPNPHWDGHFPYVTHSPLADPHFFWGPGKVEIAMRLQAAINKYVSRGMDFLDLYLDPSWLFDASSGLDPDQLFTGPGNTIPVQGDVSEKVIRQLVPDLRGFNVSLQEVQLLWQWLQQVLAQSADISLGAGEVGSDRQSAHEWVGRENAINLRSRLELFRFEEQAFIPLLTAIEEMDRQWLTFPVELGLLGSAAIWDVGTGQFMPPTQERLDLNEMKPRMRLRPLGVTRQLSVQTRMANFERLMPALGPFLPALNMRSFIADILPLYGFNDVASKLNSEEDMRAALTYYLQAGKEQVVSGGAKGRTRGEQPGPPVTVS